MSQKAYLVLENGMVFEGNSLGAVGEVIGEIVFTTGMTGYLETLTDKSYYGQIITQTFPLIGNYGVIPDVFEAKKISARGYIVKHACEDPSNFRCEGDLDSWLKSQNIIGISGIDTRQLTKILREQGTMNGVITTNPDKVDMEAVKAYTIVDAVKSVSVTEEVVVNPEGEYSVALFDYGYKENILRSLVSRGCKVTILPYNTSPERVKALNLDGIMLSNGPGDPAENVEVIENLKTITKMGIPIFGICLGHQLLALQAGFKTGKLKYGHRGGNQPAKDLDTGRTYITSQNHGYAVEDDTIDESVARLWMINVNDNTCEGIRYKEGSIFSVQYHPEGCCGPQDTGHLFDEFIKEIKNYAAIKNN